MGSRSRNNKKRQRQKLSKEDFNDYGFWTQALSAIETCEQGKTLSWNSRALLYTRFCARLPDLCERHGFGVSDGYVVAIQALVDKRKLEWFEQDAVDKIKQLLSKIIHASLKVRGGVEEAKKAFADRLVGSKYV